MVIRRVYTILLVWVLAAYAYDHGFNESVPSNITYHVPSVKEQDYGLYDEDEPEKDQGPLDDVPEYDNQPDHQPQDNANEGEEDDEDNDDDDFTPTPPVHKNPFEAFEDCHDVHQIPTHDQCQFTADMCEDYTLGFFDYLGLYYCNAHLKTITFFIYIAFLVILFTTLGLTASEYLCPNLDSISKIFKMSESLTGVTLLALGNGSPDLFGTLEAVKANSASLAIGELIGAALFITCCVVGSMAIVRPFKVAKKPFIRDVSFLLIGLTITVIFLHKGEITLVKGILMILMYVIYVLFVVLWDYFMVKRRKRQLLNRKIRNTYLNHDDLTFSSNYTPFTIEENNELNDEEILDSLRITNNGFSDNSGIEFIDTQLHEQSRKRFEDWNLKSLKMFKNRLRPSLFTVMEMNNQLGQLNSGNESLGGSDAITLNTIQNLATPKIKLNSAPQYRDAEDDDFSTYESRISSNSAPAELYTDNVEDEYRDDYPDDLTDPGTPITGHEQVDHFTNNTKGFTLGFNFNLFKILFPTLENFKENSIIDKVIIVICLPLVTVLRLTIPVIDTMVVPGSSVYKKVIDLRAIWVDNFPLLLIQSLVSPVITGYLMFEINAPLLTSLITAGFIAFFIYVRSSYNANSLSLLAYSTSVLLAILGFIISINWISAIATELISLIKFFSILFNLSDSILGLTVFAMGNSLGDLISNFTIAKMGFPMMAMSACFGGPLLNILLGIGFSVNYVVLTDSEVSVVRFDVSRTLIISCTALFINLLLLLIVVPINRWKMDSKIGYTMIGLWSTATLICVILEIFS